jgi:hypothetical protein
MSVDTAKAVIEAVDKANARNHPYASLGLVFGFLAFASCVGSFTFLIYTGHPTGAGVILGTAVLGLIQQFIKART